jgi:hypothetical protein
VGIVNAEAAAAKSRPKTSVMVVVVVVVVVDIVLADLIFQTYFKESISKENKPT